MMMCVYTHMEGWNTSDVYCVMAVSMSWGPCFPFGTPSPRFWNEGLEVKCEL